MGATQEVRLLGFADLTDELHSGCVKKRKYTCFEIISIRWVHLRGDAEGQARAASYFNGAVHTFLGCDAAKKRQIVTLSLRRESVLTLRIPMMDSFNPAQMRQRSALARRNRD